MLDGFFNAIFGWSINIHPLFGMFIITLIITLIITIAYKYLTDQHIMKSLKDELKNLQKDMKKYKEDPKKMVDIQKELMSKNMKMFKMNIKPMIVTFIPIIIIFGWLRMTYEPLGDILWMFGWLGTYIIFTLIMSFAFRKLLKVY